MPSNYYDSPPSPPTSLEDQVHVADAPDNIHLAKILLLKLKGIDVTSDDDPRIDAVKDEDFDICFVPSGRSALEEVEENVIRAAKLKERERWKEEQRAARLRARERIWSEETRGRDPGFGKRKKTPRPGEGGCGRTDTLPSAFASWVCATSPQNRLL
jgi:hypothetical protein